MKTASTTHFDTPQAAEAAFYAAFEQADALAMMPIWDGTPDITCIHPMGRAVSGLAEVSQSWQEVFASDLRLRFTREPVQLSQSADLAVSVLYEHIQVIGEAKPRPAMLATNVYRHTEQGWRLILHHASPAVVAVAEPRHSSASLH
ncbi:MAG: nuclear transport factor 2 family protein [Hydrogenophilaceae bacterium]|nr:nuclear transport factor 2 family protein [Hydrogenophilaceae bacterium]